MFCDLHLILNTLFDILVKSQAKTSNDRFLNLHKLKPPYLIGAADKHLQLFDRRVFFCYDSIDSFKRLYERQLPSRERLFLPNLAT